MPSRSSKTPIRTLRSFEDNQKVAMTLQIGIALNLNKKIYSYAAFILLNTSGL